MDRTVSDVRAGWGLRAEALESAASKLIDMLKRFGKCAAGLEQWCFHDPPFEPAPLRAEYFAEVLCRKRKMPQDAELGWQFHGWRGSLDQTFGLSGLVGVTSRWLTGNAITLSYPFGVIPDQPMIDCVFSIFIDIWKPRYVAYNPVVNKEEKRFELGERTFLSHETEKLLGESWKQNSRREPFNVGHLYVLNAKEIERLYLHAKQSGNLS